MNVSAPTLTISIVTYRPNLALLDATLRKLSQAIAMATQDELLRAVNLVLVDNTGERATAEAVVKLGAAHFESSAVTMNYLHGHANIGYGAAHNLVMHGGNTHYHLVLNPDIELAGDALAVGLRYLAEHAQVGVVVPAVFRPDGKREYLCKRYPSLTDLALRGFAPSLVHGLFRRRLDRYEMRDVVGDGVVSPVPVMSGSFMLVRRKAIEVTGGFDPRFFLYFEDFDWSVRLNRVTQTAYLPDMRVVHHGGRAAGKGLRHVTYFTRSALRFFNKHGWNVW
ncbi:MAG: glycosyltransferase family 2 protein [Betaproteobacteria bacterium]|nr:MAG: glycosyltransferase family 2 protein [Betaproteobacteria bacterium]